MPLGALSLTGKCCGGDSSGCTLCHDKFNRPNSSNVNGQGCGCVACACQWTETTGNWRIESNQLKVPTANAVLLSSVTAQNFQVTLTALLNGTVYKIYFGYVDVNNHYYFEFSGSSMALRMVEGGVSTTKDSQSIAFSGLTEVTLCNGPEGFVGRVGPVSADTVSFPVTADSGRIGLGTSTTVTATPAFDNVTIKSVGLPCPECVVPSPYLENCGACADADGVVQAAPPFIQLDITGIVNGESCTDCATALNGTFIAQINLPHGAADCSWFTDLIEVNCSNPGAQRFSFTVQIAKVGADIRFLIRCEYIITRAEWRVTLPGAWPLDCTTFAGVVVPIFDPSTIEFCDFSGSSITVSSVPPI